MTGSSSEEFGVGRSLEGVSNGQQRSGDAVTEWRSSEQVENGITSTSPPYWDTDDDDDCGPKPSELYGKYTWKIDKFSQINKRELRSNAFEVGGYKWYILIYPQGCDVCNHLSLFLCVANHDKLLPGWSHFAQFTIAVVNKDPKKSKYSDTLHRFWKKEHDWGWKKFMELSKVLDGFVDADTLIIKAQVQVIRERADRPFRCLDCQYRRELVRVYLSNVEQICRRFVEERRGRLGKLIEDKARWSSFCTFWIGMDPNVRERMSREKADSILKVAVKHFFIEKEVTSTLVMDSLYSGLKALVGQSKNKKTKGKCLDEEELPMPIVGVEKDTFVLVDDVLLLLERASLEPLPPKDEKGPQNRTKDGGPGEDFSKDSIERDERRLTELGRRTIEIFVLAHMFSKIEVAYQEAVALKRQEELIREEEAAWMTGIEQKARRGASEKEKKSKKKQAKQKRNNRKTKEKTSEEKSGVAVDDKPQRQSPTDDAELLLQKPDTLEDVSDVSDCVPETLHQPDSEDRDSSPVNWDTDTSEAHPPTEPSSRKSPSATDDSSSTCSTDSLPSVVINGHPSKGNSHQSPKTQESPGRGKVKKGKVFGEVSGRANGMHQPPSAVTSEAPDSNVARSRKADELESNVVVRSLEDQIQRLEHRMVKKEDVVSLQKEPSVKDEVAPESPPSSPPKTSPLSVCPKFDLKKSQQPNPKFDLKKSQYTDHSTARKPSPDTIRHATLNPGENLVSHKTGPQKPMGNPSSAPERPMNGQRASTAEKPVDHPVSRTAEKARAQAVSRPLSAPLVPGSGSRPGATAPVATTVHTAPVLSRSVSAAGRLGPDLSPVTQSFVPQSYRNVMMGNTVTAAPAAFSPNSTFGSSHSHPHPLAPMFVPRTPERVDSTRPWFPFRPAGHDVLPNGPGPAHGRCHLVDEFPHLDIINDLLDDEHVAEASPMFRSLNYGPRHLARLFTFPGDIGAPLDQGPSTSSCRYSYDSGPSAGPFDFSRETIPQPPNFYVNGHIDGLMHRRQWLMDGSDLSYLGLRRVDGDGYRYPDYSNVNGYGVFRPSNGR